MVTNMSFFLNVHILYCLINLHLYIAMNQHARSMTLSAQILRFKTNKGKSNIMCMLINLWGNKKRLHEWSGILRHVGNQ